jgi:hypothetical protein
MMIKQLLKISMLIFIIIKSRNMILIWILISRPDMMVKHLLMIILYRWYLFYQASEYDLDLDLNFKTRYDGKAPLKIHADAGIHFNRSPYRILNWILISRLDMMVKHLYRSYADAVYFNRSSYRILNWILISKLDMMIKQLL